MVAVAFERARKLWTPRQGAVVQARLLGALYSLLVLSLFTLGGLLAALATAGPGSADTSGQSRRGCAVAGA